MLCRAVVIPRRCFEDEYICDSSTPQYGFKTWDDLRVRPIASPKDDAVITNACESAPTFSNMTVSGSRLNLTV